MATRGDCGCGEITTTTPSGVQRDFIRGHNRRGVGKGWIEGGYRYLYVNGKKIAEHRHVVEQREGRKLGRSEIVHHLKRPSEGVIKTRKHVEA